MTHDEYAALPGVNWSTLKHMRDSPKAYRYACDNPRVDTLPFMLGRALHAQVLEPHKFWDHFAVWEEGDRRGSKWKEFAEQNAAKTILKADEFATVHAMAEAVLTDRVASLYLDGGAHERPITWTDSATGLQCKARPDSVIKSRKRLIDLKSTRSIDPRRFGNECARLGYHLQMAHYESGCVHAYGWRPLDVAFIAVERDPPHDVGVFEILPANREIAADEVAGLLQRVRECRQANRWPGRFDSAQLLNLPAYIEGQLEFEHE